MHINFAEYVYNKLTGIKHFIAISHWFTFMEDLSELLSAVSSKLSHTAVSV